MEIEKLWTRNYLILAVTNLLFFLSFQLVVPVLPLYVESLGGTDVVVGIIVGAGTLGGLIARPIAGGIADRYARLPVLYCGLILCCVMIFGYSVATSLFFLLLLRLFHGLSMGAATTSANTMVSDMLPKKRLAEGLGYYGVASTVAMAISPAIALSLIKIVDYQDVFHIAFVVSLITVLVSLFLKRSDMKTIERPKEKASLYEIKAVPAAVLLAVQTCGYCATVTFIALYGSELGISEIGIFFTVNAVCVVISRPWVGSLADKKGYSYVIVPSMAVTTLGFLLLSLGHSLPMLLFAGACLGLGFGSAFPTFQAMGVRDVSPHRRGAANATVMSGFDIGFGIGAIIWGISSHFFGYRIMYALNMVLTLCALIAYILLSRRKLKDEVS